VNPEGKRPLERPRRRWEDIRMVLTEILWEATDWVHVTQDMQTSGELL
jgi:hypothetical protein